MKITVKGALKSAKKESHEDNGLGRVKESVEDNLPPEEQLELDYDYETQDDGAEIKLGDADDTHRNVQNTANTGNDGTAEHSPSSSAQIVLRKQGTAKEESDDTDCSSTPNERHDASDANESNNQSINQKKSLAASDESKHHEEEEEEEEEADSQASARKDENGDNQFQSESEKSVAMKRALHLSDKNTSDGGGAKNVVVRVKGLNSGQKRPSNPNEKQKTDSADTMMERSKPIRPKHQPISYITDDNKIKIIRYDENERKVEKNIDLPFINNRFHSEKRFQSVKSETKEVDDDYTTTEEGFTRCKSVSPARHPRSDVIQVRGLTRPFTIRQLHELLSIYGEYDKERFWIDGVKSHCIVQYQSSEAADAARNGLHNVKWPVGNPKMLRVDFSSDDKLDALISGKLVGGEDRESRNSRNVVFGDDHNGFQTAKFRSRSPKEEKERVRRKSLKEDQSPQRVGHQDENGRRSERRPQRSAAIEDGKARTNPEKPPKSLDDLFHKTKASPGLYWKPADEETMCARAKKREMMKRDEMNTFEKHRRMEHIHSYEQSSNLRHSNYEKRGWGAEGYDVEWIRGYGNGGQR